MSLDTLTLNSTSLADTTVFGLEAIDFTPPAKKPEWAQSVDSDGSALVRTPLFENRTITASIRIVPQGSMDLALEKLGILVDLLQEAEKNPEGIPLEWSPATATKKITFYVLTGAVTGIPMVNDGQGVGWYAKSPLVTVSFTCKPFGYGAEVEAAAAKSIETGLSVVVLTVPTVAGDVPAEGRLVVTDTATVGRRFVEWGLENRYYNAATSLILDSEDMTPVGGTQSTALASPPAYKRAGATKWTIATTLLPEPTICCNTGVLKHVGTFRVKARCEVKLGSESLTENVHVRMSWKDGEGPLRGNEWQTMTVGNLLTEIDLGVITVSPAELGAQKWLGQIEAYSENEAAKDVLHIDYLVFIPVLEGYGKARGVHSDAPGTIGAFDGFKTGTLSGNLNARTPTVGAAWATTGAATDWTVASGGALRKTTSDSEPRWAVVGSAVGNSSVSATGTIGEVSSNVVVWGVVLRWVNATNFAYAICAFTAPGGPVKPLGVAIVGVMVAGVTTTLGEGIISPNRKGSEITIEATALTDGSLNATFHIENRGAVSYAQSHASLITGGALASGKLGIYDRSTSTGVTSRELNSLTAFTLAAIPYCIQPSQAMEVRSDSTLTEDATGTYAGPPPEYRGSRFFVPQDGSANRTSRILVKADRNDLEAADQQTIADAFTAQVFATPRYHVIPR